MNWPGLISYPSGNDQISHLGALENHRLQSPLGEKGMLPSSKLYNMAMENHHLSRRYIFKGSMFHCYVSLPVCRGYVSFPRLAAVRHIFFPLTSRPLRPPRSSWRIRETNFVGKRTEALKKSPWENSMPHRLHAFSSQDNTQDQWMVQFSLCHPTFYE